MPRTQLIQATKNHGGSRLESAVCLKQVCSRHGPQFPFSSTGQGSLTRHWMSPPWFLSSGHAPDSRQYLSAVKLSWGRGWKIHCSHIPCTIIMTNLLSHILFFTLL